MWKARPEDNRSTSVSPSPSVQPSSTPVSASVSPAKEIHRPVVETHPADVGHIGKSVVIRGELSGNEDLYLDGEVEGNINLRDHKLVIGPNGKIKAAITAREVVVHGRVEGNITASDRLELKRASNLAGDVATHRIVIEDGAVFKGSIDIKENRDARTEMRKPATAPMPAASTASPVAHSGAPLSAGASAQGSFLEPK